MQSGRESACPLIGEAMKKKNEASNPPVQAAPSSGVLRQLDSLYNKIPILPFLDRPTSALLIACMLGYAIFVAYIFLSTPTQMTQSISEQPLAKNTQLQLLPGERYVYLAIGPGGTQSLTYTVSRQSSCAGVEVGEEDVPDLLCLSQSGNSLDPGDAGLNSSYGNSSILLFSPWMLAVSDTFSWGFTTTVSAAGTQIYLPVTLVSQGRTTMGGREAYIISVNPGNPDQSTLYIDSQKRVLLQISSANASARLELAPFPLDWSNSTS